ncbi:MAG: hypothetical protein WBU20_13240, partial [Candidatus Acidiferrum sp.]
MFSISLRAQQPPSVAKNLQVVIISVENFDDSQYQNALLQTNIKKAADEVVGFFTQNFPAAKITILRTHDETTISHLDGFFKGTFPNLISGNMTLLFVLSHGESYPLPNKKFGSDLRIVASDTPANDIAGQTLSLTTDILNRLNGLEPGSFLFAFIDTCHSGAASNLSLKVDAALQDALGVKTMVMASSLADQLSFQASFSQALVRIWQQPATPPGHTCTVPEVSGQIVRQNIIAILGGQSSTLGPNEGYPDVLIHFQGAFCLEYFQSQNAIFDLINGSPDSYVATFTDSRGNPFSQTVNGHDAVPITLTRSSYNLALYRNNQLDQQKAIDLTQTSFDWLVVGAPGPLQLAQGIDRAATAGESVGADPSDVQSVRQLAYSAYIIANDHPNADRVAQEIAKNAGSDWVHLQELAFQTKDSILNALAKNKTAQELDSAATQILKFGNVHTAAQIYYDAAEKAKQEDPSKQGVYANRAYLAFNASGDFAAAKSIRQEYGLQVDDICATCKKLEKPAINGDPSSVQFLGNLTT